MSAADIFGLVASVAIFIYLVYALYRGEKLLCGFRISGR
jgi:K+-transporting ATPase KdpF subunit